MKLSIVLPTYNEEKNIEKLIPDIENIVVKDMNNFEILIIDDGSTDNTRKVADDYNKIYKNIKIINRGKKMGLGSAIRHGYNIAEGELMLSMDSDLSLDPNDIPRFLEGIEHNDLVVGSRHHKKGKYERKEQATRIKYIISKFGNKINEIISGVPLTDFTLNYRIIRNNVWKAIATKENTNIMLFEMILKAHHKGFKVAEIPVVFKERRYGHSKLNLLKEAPKFFFKMFLMSLKERAYILQKYKYS